MDIRCVHRDIQSYPVMPLEIRHARKISIKAAVSSCLVYPLILGWPGFNMLVGQCVEVHS